METTTTEEAATMNKSVTYEGNTYTEVDITKESGDITTAIITRDDDGKMTNYREEGYVVMEKGKPETALVLLGWDEVGLFDSEFTNPVYAFCSEAK
jgi:Fic family protein